MDIHHKFFTNARCSYGEQRATAFGLVIVENRSRSSFILSTGNVMEQRKIEKCGVVPTQCYMLKGRKHVALTNLYMSD